MFLEEAVISYVTTPVPMLTPLDCYLTLNKIVGLKRLRVDAPDNQPSNGSAKGPAPSDHASTRRRDVRL